MTNFFRSIALSFALLYCLPVFGADWNYKFDPDHSSIDYKAGHYGFSNPGGKFSKIEGNIYFDEKKPVKSKIEAIIKIGNLITGNEKLDNHLRSIDFFNIDEFPTAHFKSTKIKMRGKNSAKIYGELTLLGITKTVTLDAKLNKIGVNPKTLKKTIGFSANGYIKRSYFGMNYGIPSISDKIEINIEVEAFKI